MRPPIPAPAYHERQKRRFGEIARALDGAERDCERHGQSCEGCDFHRAWPDTSGVKVCIMQDLREIIGDPVKQHDPETEAAALAAAEQYQREIVPCPSCGGPTFTANVDDQDTRLCMSDACRWKGPAMPEGGSEAHLTQGGDHR